MTQSTRDRIQDIYLDALALPDSERDPFMEKACAGNPDCIRKVKSLLNAAARPSILDNPVANLGLTALSLIGVTIDGRYEIERELPHGGMSQVYVALHLKLNQPVVIKILSKTLVQDTYARKHFDLEVEALLRMKDPGVVDVRDRGDLADGRPFIVMEYVDGDSLRSHIQNEVMDLKRTASILAQVGTALEHVHQNGIFHRDVKPENILLRRGKDAVVLIDFGIAKVTDSVVALSTVHGTSAGTPPYMSPEQLRGERVTAASDIYSMAVVAYEMITGRKPFSPNSHAHMLELQREGVREKPTDLRPDLPKKAQRIILRALSFDPRSRPQSAKQFGVELAAALNEPPGPSQRSRLPIAKLLGITAGVLILVLLSYGIYKILVNPRPPQPRPLISQTTQTKGFNYWLTIQRTREGIDYEGSYKSNGDDVFDNGDKFQLNVQSVYSGYLYIFNDGPPEAGTTSFRLIYPKQTVNDASASIGDNHTVQSDWITFRGPAGTDNFWIVWSASPVAELEFAKNEALKHPQAGLTDQNLVKIKEYLKTMDAEVNSRAARIKASQDVQVRKRSDIVLTLAEFKHR